jgi:opacity protein-like surface antigen
MRKYLYAASAALAAVAMAPAASASVTIACPGASGGGYCTFDEPVATGAFSNKFTTAQSFADVFTINLSDSYLLSITAAFNGGPINFTQAGLYDSLDNLLDTITFDNAATFFSLGAGSYKLKLAGTAASKAVYSGNIFIEPTAVPEPASWSLMVVGLGLLGATMRRRQRVARVAFS